MLRFQVGHARCARILNTPSTREQVTPRNANNFETSLTYSATQKNGMPPTSRWLRFHMPIFSAQVRRSAASRSPYL